MPVILAIESNQQQIAQLTAIVRGLGAKLVVAKTAERALATLDDQIPDLILTPPLLSPKDESALTTRLRELGTAALPVQLLSMPVLATPVSPARDKRTLLRRTNEESVGCAPDVFGTQLSEYLERAAAEKRRLAAVEEADLSAAAKAIVETGLTITNKVEGDPWNDSQRYVEADPPTFATATAGTSPENP